MATNGAQFGVGRPSSLRSVNKNKSKKKEKSLVSSMRRDAQLNWYCYCNPNFHHSQEIRIDISDMSDKVAIVLVAVSGIKKLGAKTHPR